MKQQSPKIDLDGLILNDNLVELENALNNGADVNYFPAGADKNPFLRAIIFKKKDAVKILLNHGADVNVRMKSLDIPALCCAISTGDIELVELIMSNGVRIEPRDTEKLLNAATDNRLYILSGLMAKNLDISVFFTPYQVQVINLLLSHGIVVPMPEPETDIEE